MNFHLTINYVRKYIYLSFTILIALVTVVVLTTITSSQKVIDIDSSKISAYDFNSCKLDDAECLSAVMSSIYKKDGLTKGVQALKAYLVTNPGQVTSCHTGAHRIGDLAWKEYGNIQEIYELGSGICSFGLLHGAITGSFDGLSEEEISKNAKVLCSKLRSENPSAGDECDHGIGHAAVVTFLDFTKGALLCEELSLDISKHSCVSGAVMEYTSAFSQDPIQAAKLSADLYSKCLDLSPISMAKACVFAASSPSIRSDGKDGDPTKAWARCKVLGEEFLLSCAEGIGVAMPSVSNWSIPAGASVCNGLPAEYGASCVEGMVNIFGTVFLDYDLSLKYCAELKGKLNEICTAELPTVKSNIEKYRIARS
jgi:hypothetical protein